LPCRIQLARGRKRRGRANCRRFPLRLVPTAAVPQLGLRAAPWTRLQITSPRSLSLIVDEVFASLSLGLAPGTKLLFGSRHFATSFAPLLAPRRRTLALPMFSVMLWQDVLMKKTGLAPCRVWESALRPCLPHFVLSRVGACSAMDQLQSLCGDEYTCMCARQNSPLWSTIERLRADMSSSS
jgi:hypothetical protein